MAQSLRVSDFGAVPGDGLDAAAAIERAAAATPVDGTLLFPSGEYRLGRTVDLAPDRHYAGEAGTILRWTGSDEAGPALRLVDAAGGGIEGMSLVGRGLVIEGASRDLSIDNCLFQDIPVGDALSIRHPSSGIVISRNRFRRIGILEDGREDGETGKDETEDRPARSAIRAADPDRLTIAGNRFDTVQQGITLSWTRAAGRDILIMGNRGKRIHRAGIEASGAMPVNGLLVRGNVFQNFLRPWTGSVGLSIRLEAGRGIRILGNSLVADAPPSSGMGYGHGIALGGRDAVVEGNRIEGEWAAGILLDNAPSALVVGNRLCRPGAATILATRSGQVFVGGNSIDADCP